MKQKHVQIDVAVLKLDHPIEGVLARYGIELRRQGRALVGRCPFHEDRGKPNLAVWPEISGYRCWRCGARGDAIRFVMEMERCSFPQAAAWLVRGEAGVREPALRVAPPTRRPKKRDPIPYDWAALEAACVVYSNRLMNTPEALRYLQARGVDRDNASRLNLGYVEGNDLQPHLALRGIRPESAELLGLLKKRSNGSYYEHFEGRIVIPDYRLGEPRWLVGRAFDLNHWEDGTPAWRAGRRVCKRGEDCRRCPPKYLCMPGPKPLMGIGFVVGGTEVWVVEGPFDRLPLLAWGLPAVALIGTHPSEEALEQLRQFDRATLVLDSDSAGREAAEKLLHELGPRARTLQLPPGYKDLGELAALPDGRERFLACLNGSVLRE